MQTMLERSRRAWHKALGEAAWLLGGVHEVPALKILGHHSQGNYMRKIFAGIAISLGR